MELFAKIVNGWKLLPIFAKSCILEIWQGFEYAFAPEKTTEFQKIF